MIGLLEGVGYAIVGAGLLQAMIGLSIKVRQHFRDARLADIEVQLFQQRADLLLHADRQKRDRGTSAWNGYRKFSVARKAAEAKDVYSYDLKPHDEKPLPPFLAGQYLTFQLTIPGQAQPVVRCYSLSDGPARLDRYRVTIKRLGPPPDRTDAPPGLSSSFFHDQVAEGDILDVKAPAGQFHLDQSTSRPVVLIAGGIGLTPVLSMLNSICDSGSRRETWLFYGVTNRTEHAMFDHLAEIRKTHDNIRIVVCYSHPSEACVQGRDYDVAGFVSVDLFKTLLPSNNFDFYVCGPPPMMEAITKGLTEWGVPDAGIKFEAFGPATVKRKPPSDSMKEVAAAAMAGGGIEVQFSRSGKTLMWGPDTGSLLDLAEGNGIMIDSGCRAGNCGTCVTAIREGSVSYLSEPGAQPQDGTCLACIAVPRGRLVLDS